MPRRKHSCLRATADLDNQPVLTLTGTGKIELTAAGKDDAKGPRRFEAAIAYAGGKMHPVGFAQPVVVDLAGLKASGKTYPILRDHQGSQILGHADRVDKAGDLRISGAISGSGAAVNEFLQAHDQGFPWKLSIGTAIHKMVFVREGQTKTVNAQAVSGPCLVVRSSTLREVSACAVPADTSTSLRLAAQAALNKELTMPSKFTEWLEAKGFATDAIDEPQTASLKAMWEGETAAAKTAKDAKDAADAAKKKELAAAAGTDPVADYRLAQAVESERVAKIREVCAGQHTKLEAQAIGEGWDATKLELEVLRASRTAGPAIHSVDREIKVPHLEAAVRLAGSEMEAALVDEYGEETIERAERYRGMGFRDLFTACCAMEGRPGPRPGQSQTDLIAAGFSTISLSGILGDSARKSMWGAYRAIDSAARQVAKKLSVGDFLTHTGYRMTGDFTLAKVGAAGELKHTTVSEESYTYSADTYGLIFGITRQMLKNDDMNAFTEIPRNLGRGAALALEKAFFTLLLANTGSFYAAGSSNYVTGATYALSSTGLKKAVETFRKQTDADGNPIALTPAILLVPPELEEAADELFVSTNVNTGGSSSTAKVPNRNVYAAKYRPVQSPYLSNSNYSGYSTTAWYLMSNPADAASFGIAYVDGRERPTIEDAPLPSDLLGQAWRAYFDFGVCQVDSRASVMLTGAAA